MMKEGRRLLAPQRPRQLDLPPRRYQQVVAAYDERHLLCRVVNGRGELIGPMAVAIAHQKVAALLRRTLFLRAVTEVEESFDRRRETDPQPSPGCLFQPLRRACPWIAALGCVDLARRSDVAPRTGARIDEAFCAQPPERRFVN